MGIAEDVERKPLTEWFHADEMLSAVHEELADGDLSSFVKRIG
jgi:hypothetical protein